MNRISKCGQVTTLPALSNFGNADDTSLNLGNPHVTTSHIFPITESSIITTSRPDRAANQKAAGKKTRKNMKVQCKHLSKITFSLFW